jgi:hypothetical protein
MKKTSIILLIVIVLLQACTWDGHRVKGNGNVVTQTRQVGDFTGVELGGSFDVYLSEGAAGVKIEAEENIIPYIELHVENGVLHIDTKDNVWLKTRRDVKIFVTAPHFNKVNNSGSGDIKSLTKITHDERLSIDLSGSGDLTLNVDAPEIDASITGSGGMKLAGDTKKFNGEVTGSGDIEAMDLKSEESKLQITGSGNIDVYSSVKLVADITGSGNIHYKGDAKVNSNISGSGEVKKVD